MVRQREKEDVGSSRDNPSDSTIDIHILGNRYVDSLDAEGAISNTLLCT